MHQPRRMRYAHLLIAFGILTPAASLGACDDASDLASSGDAGAGTTPADAAPDHDTADAADAGSDAPDGETDAATLTCNGRVLNRGGSPDIEALCIGKADCTEVSDVLVSGCPNTLFCVCGGGKCYGPTQSAVGCADAGSEQCGDRLCKAGEYCAITTFATAPPDGGARAQFQCVATPSCDAASTCDCLKAASPACSCVVANGGAGEIPYVTCSQP